MAVRFGAAGRNRHNAAMTRRRVVIAVVVLAAVGIGLTVASRGGDSTRADPPRAFCRAAERYEQAIQRESMSGRLGVDRQIELVGEIAAAAPPVIAADAQVFVDALRRVRDDPSVRDDPAIKRAVDNVNRYAAQGCGAYKGSGGL